LSKKKPKIKIHPDTSKNPKMDPQNRPESIMDKKPVWRLGMLDIDGEWGWGNVESRDLILQIHSTLKGFETMTWAEIENKKSKKGKYNHLMPVNQICKRARDRLREIELDDFDTLYSLRLSNLERVWGKRDNEAFYLLWWDPEHTVCPVPPVHT
jgi:hypothetical protein